MVEVKKELLAPCGLYCGVCAVYIAHRDNNLKFKERIVKVYAPFTKTIDDIKCTGCMSEINEDIFGFCRQCKIRDCVKTKNLEGCYQCDKFPCVYIRKFPMPVGKKVILRAIPFWKENGTEKYVEEEEKRYICSECGNSLFRGAKKCNQCQNPVNVD